jgi:hypothetical protein
MIANCVKFVLRRPATVIRKLSSETTASGSSGSSASSTVKPKKKREYFVPYREVTPEMKRNNAIIGSLLFAFVGGVYYYSIARMKTTVSRKFSLCLPHSYRRHNFRYRVPLLSRMSWMRLLIEKWMFPRKNEATGCWRQIAEFLRSRCSTNFFIF